ncbi:MAG: cytochrome c [Cyclobacteriaceae bacterium]
MGLLVIGYGGYSQEVVDGSAIFATNCAACHTIGQGQLVGPDLKGVTQKYEKSWITRFIRESQTMVDEGDEKAVAVFNANNMIPMPAMPLTNKEIDALLEHIAKISSGQPRPELEPVVTGKKETTPAKVTEKVKRKLPHGQNTSVREGLIIGLWIVLSATTVMVIGIRFAIGKHPPDSG